MNQDRLPEYLGHITDLHPAIPWRNIRGMRNRIAHGYFDINLDVVWDTVHTALPDLLPQLSAVDPNRRKLQQYVPLTGRNGRVPLRRRITCRPDHHRAALARPADRTHASTACIDFRMTDSIAFTS